MLCSAQSKRRFACPSGGPERRNHQHDQHRDNCENDHPSSARGDTGKPAAALVFTDRHESWRSDVFSYASVLSNCSMPRQPICLRRGVRFDLLDFGEWRGRQAISFCSNRTRSPLAAFAKPRGPGTPLRGRQDVSPVAGVGGGSNGISPANANRPTGCHDRILAIHLTTQRSKINVLSRSTFSATRILTFAVSHSGSAAGKVLAVEWQSEPSALLPTAPPLPGLST